MGSTVNLNQKLGISFNGIDILDLDPEQVKKALKKMNQEERELVTAMIKSKAEPDFDVPDDYAKDYGRPSISKVTFMSSENDGYPYLGHGHSPNCDGELDYKENIYTKEKICWCMWATKTTKDTALWKHYNKTGKVGLPNKSNKSK